MTRFTRSSATCSAVRPHPLVMPQQELLQRLEPGERLTAPFQLDWDQVQERGGVDSLWSFWTKIFAFDFSKKILVNHFGKQIGEKSEAYN